MARARIDVVIANDRHHAAMSFPVVEALEAAGRRCRILSLCELRGLASPSGDRLPGGVTLRRLVPFRARRSPAIGRASRPGRPGLARRALRAAIWPPLAWRLRALLGDRPDLVVLPNDDAYPYDRIARLLRRRRVPFLLIQEGIRFPLPAEPSGPAYGAGGAAAIAAWGRASAEYFVAAGAPADRVHLTGNPRFDSLAAMTGEERRRAARSAFGLPQRTLLLVSNPVDDQGFCSHEQKMGLIDRFLGEIGPLFGDPEFHLAIKLHGREDPEEFRRLIATAPPGRVSLFTDEPLWDLLAAAAAAVVLASTVGLEALVAGLPLAVLEIPGHGFQYDYVQSGVAIGLSWGTPLAPSLKLLFEPSEPRQTQVNSYVRRQLGTGQATARVVALINRLLAQGP